MARRLSSTEREVLKPTMARHIRDLGLRDASAYLAWCRDAGVSPSLDKSTQERSQELAIVVDRKAAQEARARIGRNPRLFLTEACAGKINPSDVTRPGWREAALAISRSKAQPNQRESLATFLLHLERVSDLVFETAKVGQESKLYLEGLIRLHERKGQWLRDPLQWRPESHNAAKQFSSLTRHLLTHYDVPIFLDSAWLRDDKGAYLYRDWFAHMGRGHNIRTAKTPYPMTKMIAHHFANAPDDATIEGALMLADIRALGGGQRLAMTLMATRLGARVETDAERRTFWLSVYRFFIANPMLDLRHAGPIIDFLFFQRFQSQEVMVGPGQVEVRPPPQPNLSMARRTPESLLRQVEAWHGDLRKLRGNENRMWRSSGIRGLALQSGPRDRPAQQIIWTLRELLSTQDLVEEGRRLRHCVATYARSCAAGACSIWSLERRFNDETRAQPILTIEVDAKGVVVEARGRANRWPNDQEKNVLEVWMKEAGLKPGPFYGGR
jgi:hypothetical protein